MLHFFFFSFCLFVCFEVSFRVYGCTFIFSVIFSSPELAQGELLGYRDVRRKCGRP